MVRYLPILKWKQAEYGALSRLDTVDRDLMMPLIEILPLDGNYTPSELVQETIGKFQLVATKNGLGHLPHGFGLDGRYMFPGGLSVKRLARMCAHLHKHNLKAWPIVDPDRVLTEIVDVPLLKQFGAAILRVPARATALADTMQALAELRKAVGKLPDLTVVLDLEGFGDADNKAFIKLIDPMVKAILADSRANRVVLAGGSFPVGLSALKQGRTDLERREWTIWSHFHKQAELADVVFGDYAVTNPKLLVIPKGTPIPVLAQIRYTMTDRWVVHRAAVVKGAAGFQQYKHLCTVMLASPEYRGARFSYGDGMIRHHSDPATTTGSPWTWRRDATSHHLVYTVRQLTLPGGVVPAVP